MNVTHSLRAGLVLATLLSSTVSLAQAIVCTPQPTFSATEYTEGDPANVRVMDGPDALQEGDFFARGSSSPPGITVRSVDPGLYGSPSVPFAYRYVIATGNLFSALGPGFRIDEGFGEEGALRLEFENPTNSVRFQTIEQVRGLVFNTNGDLIDDHLGDLSSIIGDWSVTRPQQDIASVVFLATDSSTAHYYYGLNIDWVRCHLDSDGDLVDDLDDICAGFDDRLDADIDGVPDGCDIWPNCDDAFGDHDFDDVCDDVDTCFGNNATGDADADNICDDADACFGYNESGNSDGDGVCNDRDVCPDGDDALGDLDGDGICDLCQGENTGDADGDGVCDGLDPCFGGQASGDSDLDGVCNDVDQCPGFDDAEYPDTDLSGLCDIKEICIDGPFNTVLSVDGISGGQDVTHFFDGVTLTAVDPGLYGGPGVYEFEPGFVVVEDFGGQSDPIFAYQQQTSGGSLPWSGDWAAFRMDFDVPVDAVMIGPFDIIVGQFDVVAFDERGDELVRTRLQSIHTSEPIRITGGDTPLSAVVLVGLNQSSVTGMREAAYERCRLDSDHDGVPDIADLCETADDTLDADGDGRPDACDFCFGNDRMGDADADGLCDDIDSCFGANESGDTDADRVCDDRDLCEGDDIAGDTDGDGLCDDVDLCTGANASGDSDGDGFCDDVDLCSGDNTSGDTDADGICDSEDVCPNDAAPDSDGDLSCSDDCAPADPTVSPLATEVCDDNIDNDCDTLVDQDDPDCSPTGPDGGDVDGGEVGDADGGEVSEVDGGDIEIDGGQGSDGGDVDAGSPPSRDGGPAEADGGATRPPQECGCSQSASGANGAAGSIALLLLGVVGLWRRRRDL